MLIKQQIKEVCIPSPCDLYGRDAYAVHALLSSTGGVVWLKKAGGPKACRADSLLSLLALGVNKGDLLQIGCTARDRERLLRGLDEIGVRRPETLS